MHDAHDLLPLQADVIQSGSDGENGVLPLYTRLRTMILDGAFPPGSMLSQVKLAESLGVSRIPLREALRMLQNEGLIEAEYNQRARIPSFEPSIVDSLYAGRILLAPEGQEYEPAARPGARLPHLWLPDGASLYDRLGNGVSLLRLRDDAEVGPFIEAAEVRGVPLTVLELRGQALEERYGASLLLVRPDQHVAWRGAAVDRPEAEIIIERVWELNI